MKGAYRAFQGHELDGDIRGAYGMKVADLDGDGHLDIIAGSIGRSVITWYQGPTFERRVVSESHPGNITIAAHDMTGTGFKDLIVGSGFGRRSRMPVDQFGIWRAESGGCSTGGL